MEDRAGTFAKTAAGNFPFKFMGASCELFWENSFPGRVIRSSHLIFVEPAIINLFLIIPAVRGNSAKQIRHRSAETLVIHQIAEPIFLPVQEISGQDAGGALALQWAIQVTQEMEWLESRLELLKLRVGPAAFGQSFPDWLSRDLETSDAHDVGNQKRFFLQ